MWSDVAVVWFFAFGLSFVNSVQSVLPVLLEFFIGFPGGLAALLVNVVGSGGFVRIVLSPGGDGFVESEIRTFSGAFGYIRSAVDGVHGLVVGEADQG